MASEPGKQYVIVLGAGVTGLTSALTLKTTPSTSHLNLTIIAAHYPGDSSISYTSPYAGGDWSAQATSSPSDTEMRAFDTRTFEKWAEIIDSDPVLAKEMGIAFKENRCYFGEENGETEGGDGRGIWWKDVVRNFKVLDLKNERDAPSEAVMGISYISPCIDVPKHLNFLVGRLKGLDVTFIKSSFDTSNGLSGAVKSAKSIATQSQGIQEKDIIGVINCTGLGAKKFVDEEEAAKLYPIRGQTILVKGESNMDRTYDAFPRSQSVPSTDLAYVIPRPGSGTTILGGCKEAGNWNPDVDQELSKRIIERIKKWKLAEELRGTGGDFEILSEQAGLRPGREGGTRVEVEKGEVDGIWIVHSYGHAGAGYQRSTGSAEKVVRLVENLVGR